MSNRRIFITVAETIRAAYVDNATKRVVAGDLAIALKGVEDFDPDRFQEHALSDTAEGKWAYNRRTGEGPGQVGEPQDEDNED